MATSTVKKSVAATGFPMGGEKRAPWRPLTSLRRRLDAMFSQNIGDGAPGYGMAEIREGAANACIPPPRIRLRHPYDKLANLGHDSGPSGLFPPLAVVPLPRNQPSVPSQQGFRCDDTGDFCQEFPAKRLTLYREPTSLIVCETKPPPAEPSFEDFVLLEQVDDSGLLVTLEPTSDCDDQQCQGLDRRAHDRRF